ADERSPCAVLLVARLLAHEHQLRSGRSLAEHRLRAALPQRARLATGGRLPQSRQRGPLRDVDGGGLDLLAAHATALPALRPDDAPRPLGGFGLMRARRLFGLPAPAFHSFVSILPSDPSPPALHLVSQQPLPAELLESYRRLADVFHEVLSEQSL